MAPGQVLVQVALGNASEVCPAQGVKYEGQRCMGIGQKNNKNNRGEL